MEWWMAMQCRMMHTLNWTNQPIYLVVWWFVLSFFWETLKITYNVYIVLPCFHGLHFGAFLSCLSALKGREHGFRTVLKLNGRERDFRKNRCVYSFFLFWVCNKRGGGDSFFLSLYRYLIWSSTRSNILQQILVYLGCVWLESQLEWSSSIPVFENESFLFCVWQLE